MITVTLHSGLGNQMFMVAATIGLAKKHNTIAKFQDPLSNFKKYLYNLNPLTHLDTISIGYRERSHNYNEIPFTENMQLNGYFQSEKYFKHCRNDIIKLFGTNESKINKTSIHIRRGDYLDNPNDFPTLPLNYYTSNMTVNKEYLLFSDDIPWCKEAFKNYNNIEYSTNKTALEDIKLMSRCEHNIIANSTFSWWGAWLNQNPNKIIIAPKLWFGPGLKHVNTKDIIPNEWIKK